MRPWPDTTVEESNLTYHVFAIRKALGENGDSGPYIETVPKRGNRFVAEVRRVVRAHTGEDAPLTPTVALPDPSLDSRRPTGARRRMAVAGVIAFGALLVLRAWIVARAARRNCPASFHGTRHWATGGSRDVLRVSRRKTPRVRRGGCGRNHAVVDAQPQRVPTNADSGRGGVHDHSSSRLVARQPVRRVRPGWI